MLLAWDFESTSEFGQRYITRTSQDLLEEVTYPIAMHEVIDNRLLKNEALINNLFVSSSESRRAMAEKPVIDYSTIKNSEILSLKNGYGFIKYPPNNLFFHFSNLKDVDFNDLSIGNRVSFRIVKNDNGEDVATDVQLSDEVYEM
jgi:cold shock CspA family protein